MIFDRLSNIENINTLNGKIAVGLEFLVSLDPAGTKEGKIDIGGGVYAIVQTYDTAASSEKKFESHRKYIDIQCVLSGVEVAEHAFVNDLDVLDPYNQEKDVEFFEKPQTRNTIRLGAGDFAIFYPWDAHKPGVSVEGKSTRVLKIVVKVPLGEI